MDSIFDEFRANMKYYREQRGMTQAELAIQADSSNGMIGNIESGKAYPSFKTITGIARALGVHPADLFLRNASAAALQARNILADELIPEIQKFISRRF